MTDAVSSPLVPWENFYVIMGSSAAALTGLQFVVIALGADARALGGEREIRAFGTPTIVHLAAVLLISAIMTAPWRAPSHAGIALLVCGAAGLAYAAVILHAALGQTHYRPVLEDWVWHCIFPPVAYAALLTAGILINRRPLPALFVIGAAALFLLLTAIHNAWDAVTYMAIARKGPREEQSVEKT